MTASDLEKSFTFDNNVYVQAMCASQIMCKHTELKRALFLKLWVLQKV